MLFLCFSFGEMKETMKILSRWACVWPDNESQHLQNSK